MRITVALAFHREGRLADDALRSAGHAITAAAELGIEAALLATLDRADELTRTIVQGFQGVTRYKSIALAVGDLGESRNAAISASSNADFVVLADGDDILAPDAIIHYAKAATDARAFERTVFHPGWIIQFGETETACRQVSSDDFGFEPLVISRMNPWISQCFARRELFMEFPFKRFKPYENGLGYEDWQWHGETLSAGIRHQCLPELCHFVRIKAEDSLNKSQNDLCAIPGKMGLRSLAQRKGG